MNLLQVRNRIVELVSVFVAQIKGSTSLGQTDINKVSETVLVSLLAEIFGYSNLRNLNSTEKQNYPAIDLADNIARVAFQITSTATGDKVKQTTQAFIEHKLYLKYGRVIVYVLTEKQKSYQTSTYSVKADGGFSFDPNRDIWDYTDLLGGVEKLDIGGASKVLKILEANLGNGDAILPITAGGVDEKESVYLNLLQLSFPDNLYVAELDFEPNQSPRRRARLVKSGLDTSRKKVQELLQKHGLKFSLDWVCHGPNIITFHNLEDEGLPLARIVDKGTITPLRSWEYYEIDEDHERVFKSLLSRCMQQQLYHRQVKWQQDKKEFIFCAIEEGKYEVRVESWQGEKWNDRTVFEPTFKTNEPDQVWYCKHLAFEVEYRRFGQEWFAEITPDWFFSRDGYKESYYASEKVTWLKRKENSAHLYNHVRFLAYFLKHQNQEELFAQKPFHRDPFLTFGSLVSFDNAPLLKDKEWNPPDEVEVEPTVDQVSDNDQLSMF